MIIPTIGIQNSIPSNFFPIFFLELIYPLLYKPICNHICILLDISWDYMASFSYMSYCLLKKIIFLPDMHPLKFELNIYIIPSESTIISHINNDINDMCNYSIQYIVFWNILLGTEKRIVCPCIPKKFNYWLIIEYDHAWVFFNQVYFENFSRDSQEERLCDYSK